MTRKFVPENHILNAKTRSRRDYFEHGELEKNENFRLFRAFRGQNKTTDFRDLRDVNHERKRKIPLICEICVQEKTLRLCVLKT